MSWFGRNTLIGLGVSVTLSTGLIALLIIKEALRRRNRRLLLHNTSSGSQNDAVDSATLSAAVRGLSPEQHVELRKTLDEVMKSVSSLKNEIAELREGLRDITTTIAEDVKKTVEESQRSRRRRMLMPRERSESVSSSSIYFTASAGVASQYDDSEVGYSTAYSNVESDYTDRETDKDGEDDGRDSDEEEEQSCATVLTLQLDHSQLEEEDDEDAGLMVDTLTDCPSPELSLLLAQCDLLHAGDSGKKAEGFKLLTENRPLYADNVEFMWRLARAYSDMCETTGNREEKRNYAEQGHYEAEAALMRNGLSADCHKWFAVLARLSSQYESIHGKLKSGHVLKEHLDRALALRDDDPTCFYLLGRWCLEVSSLGWLERKAAATLYKTPPTSSLNEALENFLKAEELNPGFSKTVRLYIAKCHKELGNVSEARNWVQLSLSTPAGANEDSDSAALQEELKALIDSSADLSKSSIDH
ncbi:regulator of microtubule dynamics protein 3 [Pimephales promelas]|uniref:regulator of microtubule dynamics protein 3 n=1 Tax=Pimephales promelas TaxID=90988 RepID=UPI001955DB39|nr:regulator of microtubule dynamics protein 3 [Pimephales promelas]KAG1938420.1 regulator of microtubule dynamics protein [Pimephales promelas]